MLAIVGVGLLFAQTIVPSQKVKDDHAEYLQLNRQIYAQHTDPESERIHISESSAVAAIETRLHDLVEETIPISLTSKMSVDGIKKAIDTLQGEFAFSREWYDSTNLPFADFSQIYGSQTLAVAYAILQGGDAIPDTKPYIEFYKRENDNWNLKATTGSDFEGCSLFMARMNAGVAGEDWYLVWGKTLGDTGSRLKVRLYAFDGNAVRTVWTRDQLTYGLIEVTPTSVTLDYDPRYAPQERLDRVHEVLHVAPDGLR